MEGDKIFVNTDSNCTLASQKIESLKTKVTHRQSSTLRVIQSNVKGNSNIFAFGGKLDDIKTQNQRALAFGRTASAVFRMVMLQAVQINERHWPDPGNNTKKRNKQDMRREVTLSSGHDNSPFKLLGNGNNDNDTEAIAREYWSRYDQAFPPSLIQNEVLKNKGRKVDFKNTMLILRDREEVKQVIEITTEAHATMYPPGWRTGEFYSDVKVSCTVKEIEMDEIQRGQNNKILQELREMTNAPRPQEPQAYTPPRSAVLRSLRDRLRGT